MPCAYSSFLFGVACHSRLLIQLIIIHMLKIIITILLLLTLASSLKFIIHVNRAQGAKCFYQSLTLNQKYFFQVISRTHQSYRLDVMRSQGNRWDEVTMKQADSVVESISKYAKKEGTHMFCISSNDDNMLRASVQIMAGLQMANLEYLPTNTDQENLHRQIDWLESQKQKIFEAVNRQQGNGISSADATSKMSVKYIILAVVGLTSVVAVNLAFYFQTKKTLKDRKLI